MAENTSQTQTTATPASTSPEGKSPSATPVASPATKTESKSFGSLESKIEAAFAAAEASPETESPQATRGRQAPTSTEEEVDETESEEHTEETEETEAEETSAEDATEAEETEETTEAETDETVELDDVDELTAEAMKKIKGADKVPKGFVKRLVKQSAQIRDFKAEITQLKATPPVVVTPTPASPLADCDTVDALEKRIADARKVKAWAKEHPEGGQLTQDGREIEMTPEQVQARLERAEDEIDAYADRKIALTERAKDRPWEAAERILPDMFKTGSQENKLALHLLKTCPEIKTRFNDFEVVLAYALKGHRIATEEASGKAKYVRMELDAKGKPIVPTGASSTAATVKPKPKAPASPQATRPALREGASNKRTRAEVIASLPEHVRNDPEARLRALIENAEAA